MIIIKYVIGPICTGEKAVFLDKLLSTVWCNRPFFFEGKKTFSWHNVDVPSAIVHQIGWLFLTSSESAENGFWLHNDLICQDF